MRIVTENLSYTYSENSGVLAVRALSGVTLTIEDGEFFGIVGKTGSGKSTYVQHLNGLIKTEKDKGSLIIGDFNLADKKCDFKSLRAKLGMVFQYPEYQLFAETVREDVGFGINNFTPTLDEAEKEARIREAVELTGLNYDELKDKSPFELSGGQKRRVAIAGVIATRPEILVLDEPAAGLDPQGKREFIGLLHELHKKFVKTVVIVSHDMNLISENCDRAAIFADGKIAAVGTPKELFSDRENIEQCGLDLPSAAYLTFKLKEKGITLDNDFTVNGFIDAVVKKFGTTVKATENYAEKSTDARRADGEARGNGGERL